jgi:2-hydroxy-6-oxonona-2,4-dienedioate hydrolase
MATALFRNEASRNAVLTAYDQLLRDTPQAEPRRVATRFGETHLLVAGNEHAPPLVVLHGALANSALAIREAHALFGEFRLYVLDVIGLSVKSADLKLGLKGPDYAHWLEDVLDALGLSRVFIYGASFGAFVAQKLAELAPARIDRLVLLVPAGIVSTPLLRATTQAGMPLLLHRTLGSTAALGRLLDALMTTPHAALREYLTQALTHYRLDLAVPPLGAPGALQAFRRPTLVIAASDDITCPAQALVRRAPLLFSQARVEVLAGSKHIPATDEASRSRLCARVARFFLEPTSATVAE